MARKGICSFCCSPRTASSSFSFISSTTNCPESAVDRAIHMAESIIDKWNPETHSFARLTSLFYQNRREAREFVRTVYNLHKSMHFILQDSSSHQLGRAQSLMRIAMERLRKEFYQILSMNRALLDPESVSTRSSHTCTGSSVSEDEEDEDDGRDEITEIEDASALAMADLRLIAECMIASGYEKECSNIYKTMRKSIVDESIYRLGVEKFTSSQIHKMDWQVLELRIHKWINALSTAVKTLFNGERILCDIVFACSDCIRESCFAEIAKEGAMILFRFPEIVARSSKKSPERLLRILKMYAGITNLSPEIESIFSFNSTLAIKLQVRTSLTKLAEFTVSALNDFESSILKESSKFTIPGGGVHRLTIDSMNNLSMLADYGSVLSEILASAPPPPAAHSLPESFQFSHSGETPPPPVCNKIAWLILILLCKLDKKSKLYRDVTLAYLFLANNLQYVVVKVRTSNLRDILGDQWLTEHESKVKMFASNYERIAWSHVVESIPSDPTGADNPEKLQAILVKFNTTFSQAYRKQSVCVVPDKNLRDEIKLSIAQKIVPLYREFWNVHRGTIGRRRNFMPMVRYTPDELGNMLTDLYFDFGDSLSFHLPPSNRQLLPSTFRIG